MIDMKGGHLRRVHVDMFYDKLKFNRDVRQMDFRDNPDLSVRAAQMIASAALRNRSLKTFSCIPVSSIISHQLINLDLQQANLGIAEAALISELMRGRCSLAQVNLSHNSFGAMGAKLLCQGLGNNSTVQEMSLDCNQIGFAGAQGCLTAIESNSTLTQLSLSNNEFGDIGVHAVAKALEHGLDNINSITLFDNGTSIDSCIDLTIAIAVRG